MDVVYNGKPENPIKMDELGVPLFLETSVFCKIYGYFSTNGWLVDDSCWFCIFSDGGHRHQ